MDGTTVIHRSCKENGTDPKESARKYRVELDWTGCSNETMCKLAADSVWIRVQTFLRKNWNTAGKNLTQKIVVNEFVTIGFQMDAKQAFKLECAACETIEQLESVCAAAGMPDNVAQIIWDARS
jgi:hypothetical protein